MIAPISPFAGMAMGWRYYQVLIRVTGSPVAMSMGGVPLGEPAPKTFVDEFSAYNYKVRQEWGGWK